MDPLNQRSKQILDILAHEFIEEEVSIELQSKIVDLVYSLLKETRDELLKPQNKKAKLLENQNTLLRVRRRPRDS